MDTKSTLFVFGDLTADPGPQGIRSLLRVSGNHVLADFLNASFLSLQHEIHNLDSIERNTFPQVETLGLLAEAVERGYRNSALDAAFVCINQIGFCIQ